MYGETKTILGDLDFWRSEIKNDNSEPFRPVTFRKLSVNLILSLNNIESDIIFFILPII
jgi:hypothetical protein